MGQRILQSVLLFVAGFVLGTLGTVAHAAVVTFGAVRLPTGLVVSLLAVACLLAGLRLLARGRGPAFWTALGVLGAIALFSLRSFGGSVLIPATIVGYVWILGPVAIAAVVLAWPRVTLRRTPARVQGEPGASG